jgi:hypothetical protein
VGGVIDDERSARESQTHWKLNNLHWNPSPCPSTLRIIPDRHGRGPRLLMVALETLSGQGFQVSETMLPTTLDKVTPGCR